MSDMVTLIDFPPLGDDRGSLVSLEVNKTVPFDIKRVYYIFATKAGVARGFHAHKVLKQVAVCVTGSCRMLLDNGRDKEEVLLDSPTKGVLIEDLVWRKCTILLPIVCCWCWPASAMMKRTIFVIMTTSSGWWVHELYSSAGRCCQLIHW